MMSFCRKSLILIGLIVWTVITQSLVYGQPFIVFDGTLYSNKPNLSTYGVKPVTIVGAGDFDPPDWHKISTTAMPTVASVQDEARKAFLKGHPVLLDIEHWPFFGPDAQANITKYLTILSWFRSAAPGLSTGYYGYAPIRDYWNAQYPVGTSQRQLWMTRNDQTRSLADAVNVSYSSLYTFYADQAGWKKYAIANIQEARRIAPGKPVYVVLWPQYHASNKTLALQYLPQDYWLLELQTAKEYADGIVLWGGWNFTIDDPLPWNEQAPWWITTKAFLRDLQNQTPPVAPTGLKIQ